MSEYRPEPLVTVRLVVWTKGVAAKVTAERLRLQPNEVKRELRQSLAEHNPELGDPNAPFAGESWYLDQLPEGFDAWDSTQSVPWLRDAPAPLERLLDS